MALLILGACVSRSRLSLVDSDDEIRDAFLRAFPRGMAIGAFRDAVEQQGMMAFRESDHLASDLWQNRTRGITREVAVRVGRYKQEADYVYVGALVGFADGRLIDAIIVKVSSPFAQWPYDFGTLVMPPLED